ncbi:Uncharacterized protein Fot_04354 [Forsythia ovata]|uniref:Uncharacterized protein n=1 Tax=Forsythia ovata TaxID=205694 RepID=A0ABD1XD57_9LAMI
MAKRKNRGQTMLESMRNASTSQHDNEAETIRQTPEALVGSNGDTSTDNINLICDYKCCECYGSGRTDQLDGFVPMLKVDCLPCHPLEKLVARRSDEEEMLSRKQSFSHIITPKVENIQSLALAAFIETERASNKENSIPSPTESTRSISSILRASTSFS